MDFETRNRYRNEIEELGKGSATEELRAVEICLDLTKKGNSTGERSIGYYLLGLGRAELERELGFRPAYGKRFKYQLKKRATLFYLGTAIGASSGLVAIAALIFWLTGQSLPWSIGLGILLLLPASELILSLLNRFVIRLVSPKTLAKLDFTKGVPKEFASIVVIPSLVASSLDVKKLLAAIETQFFGNHDPNINFALLTDFTDAQSEICPGDEALIDELTEGIKALNQRHGETGYRPFLLFHRKRQWNEGEGCFMAWERKRGKLEEFNALILGSADTSYTTKVGDIGVLKQIRYVITLDEDTLLPNGAAKRLIGTMAHSINQARFDEKTGKLVEGYSILQPRVQVWPEEANYSTFTRVYSGDQSIDLYTLAVSDVYQDLFGEGSFVGKGIYDVRAFEKAVENKIPENRLLSHDLLEGVLGRAALVSDIVLYEGYPSHYLAYTKRLHRWIRGDWQLLPWLGMRLRQRDGKFTRNRIGAIGRWKIIDNLRRSLLPISSLIYLACIWFCLSGNALLWTGLVFLPNLVSIIFTITGEIFKPKKRQQGSDESRPIRQSILRNLFEIIFLPHKALISADAIVKTLYRMSISKKNLLQWVSAAQSDRFFGKKSATALVLRQLAPSLALSLAAGTALALLSPNAFLVALPLFLLWLASPLIIIGICQPDRQKKLQLKEEQGRELRRLARTTWLFFENFVGPTDHWLPPDHFQEFPRGIVAHRTSPTNIGLLFSSTFSAFDFAFIGHLDLITRLENTLTGMNGLQRYRGHFLNWYDTKTQKPLNPRYISSVDSGNLAASLMASIHASYDALNQPVLRFEGLLDSLDLVSTSLACPALEKSGRELAATVEHFSKSLRAFSIDRPINQIDLLSIFNEEAQKFDMQLEKLIATNHGQSDLQEISKLSVWVKRSRRQLHSMQWELEVLCPWLTAMGQLPYELQELSPDHAAYSSWQACRELCTGIPTLAELPAMAKKALAHIDTMYEDLVQDSSSLRSWLDFLQNLLHKGLNESKKTIARFMSFAEKADSYILDMDFSFLFNRQRRVFHIGFNLDSGKLDDNYYDLLASEARIASMVAIGKGDIPSSHWLYMARPITRFAGKQVLLSWSGTMFEYLMPALFMKSYENSFLHQSCQLAVQKQISYGREKSIPWGISESSYYHFDASLIYQYRAFGVPGLGYKRGLADDLVISPYSTVLALPFAPAEVLANINRLKKKKAWGQYGLIESLDFTKRRLPVGQEYAPVQTYMAHHQGMILLALANFFYDDINVRRFHADRRISSLEYLLQEQNPRAARVEHPHPQRLGLVHPIQTQIPLESWAANRELRHPQVHSLGNGSYSLLLTAAGSGFSRWKDIDLTRWRADSSLDNSGSWLYVHDRDTGELMSPTCLPLNDVLDNQGINFYPHMAHWEKTHGDIGMDYKIFLAGSSNGEIRQLEVTNRGSTKRRLSVTSYGEVILAGQEADQRHPAFNKLFIESEYIEEKQALLFWRRPRSQSEKPIFFAHLLVCEQAKLAPTAFETDRAAFIGRAGNLRKPRALGISASLSGSSGSTLDPIYALQLELDLNPYESQRLAFINLAAGSRQEIMEQIQSFGQWTGLKRSIDTVANLAREEMEGFALTSEDFRHFTRLLSALIYPSKAMRSPSALLAENRLGQQGLWPFAISGDYPILLIQLQKNKLELLKKLISAHAFWRRRGILIDIVVLNRRLSSYEQELSNNIYRIVNQLGYEAHLNQRGGLFVLREDQMNEGERTLLFTAARVVLEGEEDSLQHQLGRLDVQELRLPRYVAVQEVGDIDEANTAIPRPQDLLYENAYGGFIKEGREYAIYLQEGQQTPAPWINVIANEEFGFFTSELGLGSSWAINSGENRLTTWHNDPVSDPPAEAVYLRDEDSGQVWSPSPGPARSCAPYLIRHGAGYSLYKHGCYGIKQDLRVFAHAQLPVKIVQLRLENKSKRVRRINVSYYAEWVLGDLREVHAPYLIPDFDSRLSALFVHNPYNTEFSSRVAFLASTRDISWISTDRLEFLGARGDYGNPSALRRLGLTGNIQAGSDPCGVIQNLIWLAPGETKEVSFILGQGADRQEASEIISQLQKLENREAAWQAVKNKWQNILGQIQVKTPEKSMDIMLNNWLLYQSLSCRMWGRTALYQSSGAYGFRDQLQDVLAFLHSRPDIAREHILRAAASQFEEGDVLHWWHPPKRRGIRSRISDNLIWLPFVLTRYLEVTGDSSILQESLPYLSAETLKAEEEDRYNEFHSAGEKGSLLDHAKRALYKGATKGERGLPLMGSGDWNDGMNRIGAGGKGESVWMAFFLYHSLTGFAAVCEDQGDPKAAKHFKELAQGYKNAIEKEAWDGAWYRRAFFDNGQPVGSEENEECRIDSISQSWAVISGAAPAQRAEQAMESLYRELVMREEGILLLLKPPFDRSANDPGYIKGYAPGIRENGGQYTHGVLWSLWAFVILGRGDRAMELFNMINPIHHAQAQTELYRVEPYVLAADVYGAPPHTGRGGWTWYTGSAAWMYQIGIERILGIQKTGNSLCIEPIIPDSWPGFELVYRNGTNTYYIEVENTPAETAAPAETSASTEASAPAETSAPSKGPRYTLYLDGRIQEDGKIELEDRGQKHHLVLKRI